MATYFSPRKGIFNGLFTYINRNYPSLLTFIKIEGSREIDYSYGYPKDIFPPSQDYHLVIYQLNASYTFTLSNISINITSYSIKSSPHEKRYLSEWKVEGSYMNGDWIEIDHVTGCDDCYINTDRHYQISQHNVYDSFRVTKYLNNSDGDTFFDLYGFEVFGTICNPLNCDLIIPITIHAQTTMNIAPLCMLFLIFQK